MLLTKAALCFSSLILLVAAHDPRPKGTPGRSRNPTSTKLMSRSLDKRCTGTCEECFGEGYTLCPGSSIFCYLPGDDFYGLDSCSSDDETSTATADAPSSTATGSDVCSGSFVSCTTCFGPTYLECDDGYHCYDPNDPLYDTCPEDTGSGSDDTGSSSSSCEDLYGDGYVDCGIDACYNPDLGEVCCQDGYYCDAGETCSSEVGMCCAPGSLSSDCLGSSGGLTTSTGFSTATTTFSGIASSTDGPEDTSANGVGSLNVGTGLMLAAGLGVMIL